MRRYAVSARIAGLLIFLVPAAAYAQWGYSYHASTAEEGIQRGYADVVRSQGMANLLNSQAATQYEAARKSYIENRMRATQTYFDMRRYNTESRNAERGTPLSMEQYVRLAREQAPDTLTATQLDSLTGAVNWPAPLRKPEYGAFRSRIEKLFQDRALGYSVYSDIRAACEEFQARLQADIMQFQANDYVAGKKFLDSLIYAARGVQG
jgi:hypothetical protein